MPRNSILDYFLANAEQSGSRTAALVKRAGVYRAVTWAQMAADAMSVARGLIALGVQAEQRVCLLARTRLEWVVAEMGVLGAGAVTVPIFPSSLPDECQYIVEDSDAVIVFTEDDAQTRKLRAERARLPHVTHIVQLCGRVEAQDGWVISLDELKGRGREVDDARVAGRRSGLDEDSLHTIIYTSGTTGRPKGVVLSHGSTMYEAEACARIHLVSDADVQLLWLPLAHAFARVLCTAWLSTRHVVAFAEGPDSLQDNLRETRPTVMAGVPHLYERLYAAVVQHGSTRSGLRPRLIDAALALSAKNGEAELRGERLPLHEGVRLELLKRLVFRALGKNLREALGGRMRVLIAGGAPLPSTIAWFFRDVGLEILEGYGLTETCAATTVNRPRRNRIGTVGLALPGTQIRIADDGEVLIKGAGVMRGYWNRPEDTDDVLRNGWLHTGDIGVVDADGYLRIVDRKKDIIVTAGGENIAPQNTESLLRTHDLISQAVVHGDRRRFCTALITLEPEVLRHRAEASRWGSGSHAELTQRPETYEAVGRLVAEVNAELPCHETIKKFKILEHDFSQDSGELTPTLKVKRKVITERYKAIFDSFYEEGYR